MSSTKRIGAIIFVLALSSAFVLIVVLTAVQAANNPQNFEASHETFNDVNALESSSALSVTILSSPWALLDSNKPDQEGPNVFVVEARVTNLGPDPATNLEVSLDYDDVAAGWILLDGELPTRKIDSLDVGAAEAYYAYWFAQYPRQIGDSHQYTVTASADGVAPISTSTNHYDDNLLPARSFRSGSDGCTDSYLRYPGS